MKIVNGAYRGEQVTLTAVDVDRFCVQVKIDHGLQHGRVLDGVAYEDVCKLNA
jgi:DNA/RNA-binding protein KIN17